MGFKLKGFPTEISDYIEIPDMAELLTYPIFFDTPIEEVYKYGSDFQKKLLDMTPLRKTKKIITVLSEVKFLDNRYRSCTGFNDQFIENPDKEWHIDSEEDALKRMPRYYEETDVVHLFTSKATSMTEFNENEIYIDFDHNQKTLEEFYSYLQNNIKTLGIKGKLMPSNRIVTFTNHLHRATPSSRIEFKYMFRVVETDRPRLPSNPVYDRDFKSTIIDGNNERILNVEQDETAIHIYLPNTIKNSKQYLPKTKKDDNTSFKELEIQAAYWENDGISFDNDLSTFTPKNSIMIFSQINLDNDRKNKEFHDFKDLVDNKVELISEDGKSIEAFTKKSFYNNDRFLGRIAGTYIELTDEQADSLVKGQSYKIKFNEEAEYKYIAAPNLMFTR